MRAKFTLLFSKCSTKITQPSFYYFGFANNVPNSILMEFKKYLNENQNDESQLTSRVKAIALDYTILTPSKDWIIVLNKIFKINQLPKPQLVYYIRRLVNAKNFVIASYLVNVFKLHSEFKVTDIVLPLLFQGKEQVLDEYFKQMLSAASELAKYLDAAAHCNGFKRDKKKE